ncbi:MAG: hypothetical protein NTZ44_01155 [Candidatus Nomurabacteria bacterium]|nr:hypothetical protein [Candidatus Nomurabacteria bacterium]
MKKGFYILILTAFILMIGINVHKKIDQVYASEGGDTGGSSDQLMAGEIQDWQGTSGLVSREIESYENAEYTCMMEGTSITITPMGELEGEPKDYFIPSDVNSETGNTLQSGEIIIGLYQGTTEITCQQDYEPWDSVQVKLNTINFFGNSPYISPASAGGGDMSTTNGTA